MSNARSSEPDGVIRELREQLGRISAEATRYRRLVENASDLLVEVDETGRLLFVSANCVDVLGRPAEELAGKTADESGLRSWLHPVDLEKLRKTYHQAAGSFHNGKFQCRVLHPNGIWRWVECSTTRHLLEDGSARLVVIARDVTERIEAEQRLRHSEERFRMLAETTHEMVTELDSKGRALYVSPNSKEVIGYTAEELIGKVLLEFLDEADYERGVAGFVDLSKSLGVVKTETYRVRHRDGSLRWFEGGGVNYRTADGEMRLVTVSRDVTKARAAEAERQRLEQRMQQAQKLESLGVLAGGIAHDFNNLLTPILGEASLALMDLPDDSPMRERMERIVGATQRTAELTRQMLAYAGTESLQVEPLDVTLILREMSKLIESAATRKAVLEYDLSHDLPLIEADAAQLSQVALNLVSNASDSLGEGTGRITLRTGVLEADRALLTRAFAHDDLPEGTYVYLEVSDTGCGMDPSTRNRVFDPFFSTKFTGRGLGLAAVLGIVGAHRGAIEIDSAPGLGTRVRILFPRCENSAPREIPSAAADDSWRGSGSVLVVDDDEGVRDLADDTLTRVGFRVLSASDGASAVEIFRANADSIRAVLLDRTMPGMGGEETFERIAQIRPDVAIVLVSGYSQKRASKSFDTARLAGFLHKPFLPSTLVRVMREALERRTAAS